MIDPTTIFELCHIISTILDVVKATRTLWRYIRRYRKE